MFAVPSQPQSRGAENIRLEEACARVAVKLGPLHREVVYQKALAAELRAHGHCVSVEAPVPIVYTPSDGMPVIVAVERADLVVDQKLVIEVKVAATVTTDARIQAERYGAALNMVAAVVAFGRQGGRVCERL